MRSQLIRLSVVFLVSSMSLSTAVYSQETEVIEVTGSRGVQLSKPALSREYDYLIVRIAVTNNRSAELEYVFIDCDGFAEDGTPIETDSTMVEATPPGKTTIAEADFSNWSDIQDIRCRITDVEEVN